MKFIYNIDVDTELRLWNISMKNELYNLIESNRQHLYSYLRFIENIISPEHAIGLINEGLEGYVKGSSLNLAIFYNSQLAGNIVLESIDQYKHMDAEISYWIGKQFEGKGIVTRSTQEILKYAFEDLGLNRIKLQIAKGNTRSKKIADKLGFTLEGTMRQAYRTNDEFQDICIYSILKDEIKL
jgi:ribosomal-protein-serine acetyltransferase